MSSIFFEGKKQYQQYDNSNCGSNTEKDIIFSIAAERTETAALVAEANGVEVETTVGNVDELLGMTKEGSASCVKGVDPHSKLFRTPAPSLLSLLGPRPIKANSWQKGELGTLLSLAARHDGGV